MTWYLGGTTMCNIWDTPCIAHEYSHCQIAFIKPSTDPEDKSETPYYLEIWQFIDLLNKNQIKSFTVLANTGNYEYSSF